MRVNGSVLSRLAESFDISAVPTFILVKGESEAARVTGAAPDQAMSVKL